MYQQSRGMNFNVFISFAFHNLVTFFHIKLHLSHLKSAAKSLGAQSLNLNLTWNSFLIDFRPLKSFFKLILDPKTFLNFAVSEFAAA